MINVHCLPWVIFSGVVLHLCMASLVKWASERRSLNTSKSSSARVAKVTKFFEQFLTLIWWCAFGCFGGCATPATLTTTKKSWQALTLSQFDSTKQPGTFFVVITVEVRAHFVSLISWVGGVLKVAYRNYISLLLLLLELKC